MYVMDAFYQRAPEKGLHLTPDLLTIATTIGLIVQAVGHYL